MLITTEWHNLLMLRISGFSTDGDIDNVRLVGPRPPATYRFIPSVLKASRQYATIVYHIITMFCHMQVQQITSNSCRNNFLWRLQQH